MEQLILDNSVPEEPDSGINLARIWDDGWSFERVAQQVDPKLEGHHARFVAKQLNIPMLQRKAVKVTLESLAERVAELEGLVTSLQDRVQDLEPRASWSDNNG